MFIRVGTGKPEKTVKQSESSSTTGCLDCTDSAYRDINSGSRNGFDFLLQAPVVDGVLGRVGCSYSSSTDSESDATESGSKTVSSNGVMCPGYMSLSLSKLGLIPEDAPAESSYRVGPGLRTIISAWNVVNLLFFCHLLHRRKMITARSAKNAMLPRTEPMMVPRLGEDEENAEAEVGDSEGEDDGREESGGDREGLRDAVWETASPSRD